MMAIWQPVTNLRDYVTHNPPVVTFFVCMLILAISFIGLTSYSSTHTLPNPDTTKDWNHLLSSLSQFQLCVKANMSSAELASPSPFPLMEQEIHKETSVNSTKTPSVNSTKTPSVTSLRLRVPLVVTNSSNSGSLKDLDLHTTLNASQLNLGGNETVSVTLDILSENDTAYTCLTIHAPTGLLPMSPRPPECPATVKNISPIHVEASNKPTASQTCYSLHSKNDPTLTVMLTREEQSLAERHLLEVSVCLLGVCFILCLAVSLTHSQTRRYHWNGLDLQNEPLIDP